MAWNSSIYAALTGYRKAHGPVSLLRAGQGTHTAGGVAQDDGFNPNWRLAYNREWGANSLMVGTSGMKAGRYSDNTLQLPPTDRYTAIGFDAQY